MHENLEALFPSLLRRWLATLALCLLVCAGCAPRIDRSRLVIDQLRFHGVHRLDEGDLRGRIATQETSRTFGIRLPWTDPEYYDETSFRRDLDRIERYYQARGYYAASVQSVRLDTADRQMAIDIGVREGEPTRVATLWLTGCEPASIDEDDRWTVTRDECDYIRSRMQLRVGQPFTEAAFDADRALIADLMRDDGHAEARVLPHATVDPFMREAHVVFVLRPGPLARFGQLYLHEAPEEVGMRIGRLPHTGYPVRVALRSTAIREGSPYNRTALADAQRRLFDLGVFGIVRIDEEPHRCDSHDHCDAATDPDDPNQYVRVDLHIHVSPTRPYRIRVGGGFEIDQSRSDIHLLASYEHFRIPIVGRIERWRIDERPLAFTSLNFSGTQATSSIDIGSLLGNQLSTEFRIPEVWQGGTLVASLAWDIGPDPINPTITHRSAVRGAIGALFHFTRQLLGSAYVRSVRLDYYQTADQDRALLEVDPIAAQQYLATPQTYTYLEQQMTWDGRDNVLQTHRGIYASVVTQEAYRIDPISSYTFLRGALDVRGYVPASQNVVLAMRGFVGAAGGPPSDVNGWPVPSELRFYSGGATSNRGYPFNQVGYRTSNPLSYPNDPRTIDTTTLNSAVPNESRFSNVGGLTAWEFSTEVRWYFAPFGLAFFFDASDVTGWQPPAATNIPNVPGSGIPRRALYQPVGMAVGTPPGPQAFQFRFDPHPSIGLGFRYISPIGVIRLDIGLRIDDLIAGCSSGAYVNDIAVDNRGSGTTVGYPSYYAVSRPKCDFFGIPVPLAFSFAIGEAY